MVEANIFAICFLSVINFSLNFKWPKEELLFFPFDFSDCFPDSFRFGFGSKWRTKTLPEVFFGFQLLKRKYVFCSRVSKRFPLSLLPFFNSLFISIVKPRYFRECFFLEMWDFGIVLFAISIKVSVNWATGSSNRASSSDKRDAHRVRKDIQSALSNLQCSAAGSSSLAEVLRTIGK